MRLTSTFGRFHLYQENNDDNLSKLLNYMIKQMLNNYKFPDHVCKSDNKTSKTKCNYM